MSRNCYASLLLVSALLGPATAAAGEKLGYFGDETLSFEHKREEPARTPEARPEPSAPPAQPAVGIAAKRPPNGTTTGGREPAAIDTAPAGVPVPPAMRPQGSVRGTRVMVHTSPFHRTQIGLSPRPGGGPGNDPAPDSARMPLAPTPPTPGQRAIESVTAPPGPSSPAAMGGDMRVEVLKVRELTKDELDELKEKLRCTDPMAAEIRPDARTRFTLASMLNVPEDRLPETVSWIFSRKGSCFARSDGPLARQLEAIDEAARRAPPPQGGR